MAQASVSPFILVDGSSYLFRAFHGLPPLTNSKGQDTGAIYGVINMLKSLLKEYSPSHIGVVFDAKGKTFRNDIYADYKANRPEMPTELRDQIAPIHKIVKAMGLPLIVVPGVEADDVIGTLARQASEKGIPCVISTGDKDMAQLVNEHVSLINTMNNQVTDIEGVFDKFGVNAEHIIDFLALKGDKVDNIPGVPGVGDKSAQGMINGIGGVDDIYKNLDKLAELNFRGSKTIAKKMVEYEEQARLSYTLATIDTHVELDVTPETLTKAPEDSNALVELYKEYEFKRWLSDAQSATQVGENISANTDATNTENPVPTSVESAVISTENYQTIFTEEDFLAWVEKIKQAPLVAVDTETTSLKYMEAELVGISFCVAPGEACYIPLTHKQEGVQPQLDKKWVLDRLKPILQDENIKKVGQHIKYDKNILVNEGIELVGIASDTMLESYVLNSTSSRHNMDALALAHLGHTTISFEEIAGKGAKQLTFDLIDIDIAAPYAAEDADITFRLHETLAKKLHAEPSLQKVLTDIEIPLSSVLSSMEQCGVKIDSQLLAQQSQDLAVRINELEKEVHETAGEEFNLSSTKQLQHILFEKLSLPIIKKTPKGAPSTSEDVLQELANDYELPKQIIEFRGLTKLKTTYTDKLPKMINHRTGRVHTSYHQAVTATGRLSSTDPNLQNIPIRTPEGRRVRQAFIPEQGNVFVAADYSQIELRIMAHLSKDEGLVKAFTQGLDVHRATAAEVFGTSPQDVSDDQRRSAKAINFGLIYGMSAFGLAKQLNISRHDAQSYMDMYFARYPGVLDYMETTRELAKSQGYVETVFGRRLYLPDIKASNGARRKGAERAAINAPMQGTAADIIKMAMVKVEKWRATEAPDVKMTMQVHDELVFEIAEDSVVTHSETIKSLMETAAILTVPLIVEVGIGKNWEEAH